MNKALHFVVGLSIGWCSASIVAYFVIKKKRAEMEEEIESVRASYKRTIIIKAPEKKEESEEERKERIKEKANILREANKRIQYNGYAKLVREEPPAYSPETELKEPEIEEEPPFEESGENEAPVEYPSAPFVITPEEYAEEPQYAKEDLIYYILSDTMIDDHDVEVDDVDRLIGEGNLRHMGEIEPGCLWIRNPNVMTDYQITGVHGYWEG